MSLCRDGECKVNKAKFKDLVTSAIAEQSDDPNVVELLAQLASALEKRDPDLFSWVCMRQADICLSSNNLSAALDALDKAIQVRATFI